MSNEALAAEATANDYYVKDISLAPYGRRRWSWQSTRCRG